MPEQPSTRKAEVVDSDLYSQYRDCDRWAVIVGVSKYQYPNLTLRYADRDAEELYKLLLTPNGGGFQSDHICKLTNEQATTGNITRALRSFLKKPAREDLVLIYFACHGSPDPDRPGNVYLLTYDTDPTDIAGTALPMEDIDRALKTILHSEKVIILADTCHSAAIGGGIGGRRSTVDDSKLMNRFLQDISRSKGGVALLTSAEANEVSFEDAKWGGGHGVFTHYLLEGMRGAADRDGNGMVTIGELFEYVRDNVKKATDYRQHPSIGTNAYDRTMPVAISDPAKVFASSSTGDYSLKKRGIIHFEFRVPTVNVSSKTIEKPGFFGKKTETVTTLNISYQRGQAEYFVEDLGNGITLEMVAIPSGTFMMGSPDRELDRLDDEGPQHSVTVSPFFMGKFAVTQAQWQAVAVLSKVKIDLNPDPANFKGVNCPVESISWHEAGEFCDRLSQKTGKQYRLPSEAEWEYACRSGTTTPFYYGETITTDLANYRGTDWQHQGTTYPGFYGKGTRGSYRQQTTDVGTFPANAFGLYDMHGNVWEWCTDHWHQNYEGAPIDGSAWVAGGDNERRLIRGGSWYVIPAFFRAAARNYPPPAFCDYSIGFRVVCSVFPALF